jgi:hypothetical protein
LRRLVSLAASAILVLGAAAAASAEIAPVKVLGGPEDQWMPSGNGTWLTWTSNSVAHPKTLNAYARPVGTNENIRMNAKRTEGHAGNIIPGTNEAIFTQYGKAGWFLYFYDLDTKTRSKVPDVNAKTYQYWGFASPSYVLFDRDYRKSGVWHTDLLLYDRTAGSTEKLGTWRTRSAYVFPGSVGEATASYTLLKRKDGATSAFVFDIAGSTRAKLPVGTTKVAYDPVVDETNGYVYFARSGNGCGKNVTIRRVGLDDLSGSQTILATLPLGIDTDYLGMSLTPDLAGTHIDLLFDRYTCAKRKGDIYALRSVDTV